MATVRETIRLADMTRINTFPEEIKMRWLSELDGRIASEVMLMSQEDFRQLCYSYPEDLDREMLVDFPYDEMYRYFLEAKIDFENGEYNRYGNDMQMFNASYKAFVLWFANTFEPAQGYAQEFGE